MPEHLENGDGTIDFREYVIGLSILCNPANTEETIRMAFKLFDMDDDGTITEDEFASIIQSALGLPELDVSLLFREIDADETGKLSYGHAKMQEKEISVLQAVTGVHQQALAQQTGQTKTDEKPGILQSPGGRTTFILAIRQVQPEAQQSSTTQTRWLTGVSQGLEQSFAEINAEEGRKNEDKRK
ncbi:hypothetical protein DUI87_14112 [Hirundo rustica rustica]|uniref:EF-hand domain-containing protein n=1 Tax=Hirundo rustica rustica TaxID=333673 RepID=A0A3M0K7C0_HIRRU|nr:hypothetical protein DUI87_14112 [Hirundo rustica rustica]